MVWFYVVVGLIVLIAILILMKTESRPLRRSKNSELVTDMTYVCMHCGHTFKGSTCPRCGADRKSIEFGK